MRTTGTGGPAPKPPSSAYDKNGCLPPSEVSDGCCNRSVGGPTFRGGACCYTFPTLAPGEPKVCCGRPLIVNGEAIIAEVTPRAGWCAAAAAEPLRGAALSELASAAWLRDARMEHASIASFARFVLDLLSIGADADIVATASLAMQDEVRHAELCFGLAARFSGRVWGPLPMRVGGDVAPRGVDTILTSAVIEGCIGETVAAFIASERLAGAADPVVRSVLTQIRDDESRHAELAFRFVGTFVQTHAQVIASAFAHAANEIEARVDPSCEVGGAESSLDAAGVLSAARELTAARHALRTIVRPAFACLLGSHQLAQVSVTAPH